MNPFLGAFQGHCSGFLILLVISQNLRLIKKGAQIPILNSEPLLTSKMEFFVMIVNDLANSPILDVPEVSGYIIVVIHLCLQYRCSSLVIGNFQPASCF